MGERGLWRVWSLEGICCDRYCTIFFKILCKHFECWNEIMNVGQFVVCVKCKYANT